MLAAPCTRGEKAPRRNGAGAGPPDESDSKAMRTWLNSVVNAMLGRVPGKTSRLDTATRMAIDADFGNRGGSAPSGLRIERERDDLHLFKASDPLADINLLEELVRIVNEAQERDADDERRLYGPPITQDLTFQRRRPGA